MKWCYVLMRRPTYNLDHAPPPAKPKLAVRVEHEYERKGALNLFAAFDTALDKYGVKLMSANAPVEFIAFLEYLTRVFLNQLQQFTWY